MYCVNMENFANIVNIKFSQCAELCVFDDLATKTNCTGPWMTGISQQPCDNNKSMRALIKDYEM